MKKSIITMLLVPYMAQGQIIETDTVSYKELGEITVTADAQRTNSIKTVYLPSLSQKNTAPDGLSLLARMSIPQLRVNPMSETVKTVEDQDVMIFINSRLATKEDLNGMNPPDVKKIEYFDFPSDARFLGARHAVNFIVANYEYGGYTKLTGKERFFVKSGNASLYSKLAYGKMEYDIMINGNYDFNSHIGSTGSETFFLPFGTIERTSYADSGKKHIDGFFAALRASWIKNEKLTLRSLLSYQRNKASVNSYKGTVDFSSELDPQKFEINSPHRNNALNWNWELYSALSNGWSLNGTLNTQFSENKTSYYYSTSASIIENHADEKYYYIRGDLRLNKNLSDKVTFFANLSSSANHSNIDYTGTSIATNLFNSRFIAAYCGISMNYKKISGSLDAGYAVESNKINKHKATDHYPFSHINLQYSPNSKNNLGLYFQYATFSPDAAMKNPNIIQKSELLYISGNPDLGYARNIIANINYTWLPANEFQMTAYAVLFKIINRQIGIYVPEAPEGLMLKEYQNNGAYNHGQIGTNLTAKFFNSKLIVSLNPRLLLYKITGTYKDSHYPFLWNIRADYYYGKTYLGISWSSRSSYIDGETSFLSKIPSEYSMNLGWASKGWNIQISLANLLRSSWSTFNETFNSKYYNSNQTHFGSTYHRRINITVSYTFNYGKRINPGSEIQSTNEISSSILK